MFKAKQGKKNQAKQTPGNNQPIKKKVTEKTTPKEVIDQPSDAKEDAELEAAVLKIQGAYKKKMEKRLAKKN
jgi:hypothetical protein